MDMRGKIKRNRFACSKRDKHNFEEMVSLGKENQWKPIKIKFPNTYCGPSIQIKRQ